MMSSSKLIKEAETSMLTIGSFKVEDIMPEQGDQSSENSSAHVKLPVNRDPSVASWNLPVVQKTTGDSNSKGDFKAKLARIEKEAYEKGFEQGQKDGLALEEKKISEMARELEALFTSLKELKAQIYYESERELLKLSMILAQKIIGQEVKTDREIICNTIRSAMNLLADKRKVKININPDDMEEVIKLLPDLAKMTRGGQFQLTEDRSIGKGGCILETGFGKINATVEDQLAMLGEEIEQQFQAARGECHGSLS